MGFALKLVFEVESCAVSTVGQWPGSSRSGEILGLRSPFFPETAAKPSDCVAVGGGPRTGPALGKALQPALRRWAAVPLCRLLCAPASVPRRRAQGAGLAALPEDEGADSVEARTSIPVPVRERDQGAVGGFRAR